jgi:hypothetical protein
VAADIRRNSQREYPLTRVSALGLGNVVFGSLTLWLALRKRLSAQALMLILFTAVISSIVLLSYYFDCTLVPQPNRYGVITDMALSLCLVFGGAVLWRRLPAPLRTAIVVILVCAAAVQVRHGVRFARGLIRPIDPTTTTAYHLAQWMDEHMQGERVFVGGAQSFHFNAFTDTPQLHGGHDPMQPSILSLIAGYVIPSGANTGTRDIEICTIWLKALGARALSVPGPRDDAYYQTFPHPERFAGHFPVLWHESDTTVYGVPTRSHSLAHVVPEVALVHRAPYNGLDVDEMSRYVAALEDPALPEAPFRWLNRHSAAVEAKLEPGQVVSIQERYMPGWIAEADGRRQPLGPDGLGFMTVRPDCTDCRITVTYEGSREEHRLRLVSLAVSLFAIGALVRARLRK